MRKNDAVHKKRRPRLYSFFLFCCVCLFSSCSSLPSNTFSSASPTTSSSARIVSAATKPVQDPATLKAQSLLNKMSLDDKIAQMIMVEFLNADYVSSGLQQMITQHVGGVLYQPINDNFYAPNNTIAGASAFSSQMASDSSVAPLIAIDQEGGLVDKVSQFYGASPSAEQLALSGTDNQAYNQAKIDASELKQLGVNVDLAPVVDVGSDVSPFYSRRFSSDPNTVTTYAGAFVKGLQENGIPAALKHFPGLGSVNEDPHYELPVVSRNLNDLQNIDFLPYKNIIQQDNPAMIMTTDVVTQALDANNAAELSPKVIDYLRHTLNFNGVIITDGMYMAGLYGHDPLPDELIAKSVQAINAGNDIIEGPSTPDEVSGIINGIKTEIQNGTLSQSQIDQSVLRILTMKIKYGIIK